MKDVIVFLCFITLSLSVLSQLEPKRPKNFGPQFKIQVSFGDGYEGVEYRNAHLQTIRYDTWNKKLNIPLHVMIYDYIKLEAVLFEPMYKRCTITNLKGRPNPFTLDPFKYAQYDGYTLLGTSVASVFRNCSIIGQPASAIYYSDIFTGEPYQIRSEVEPDYVFHYFNGEQKNLSKEIFTIPEYIYKNCRFADRIVEPWLSKNGN